MKNLCRHKLHELKRLQGCRARLRDKRDVLEKIVRVEHNHKVLVKSRSCWVELEEYAAGAFGRVGAESYGYL